MPIDRHSQVVLARPRLPRAALEVLRDHSGTQYGTTQTTRPQCRRRKVHAFSLRANQALFTLTSTDADPSRRQTEDYPQALSNEHGSADAVAFGVGVRLP